MEQIQLKHRSDHEQYLGAKSLAEERNAREKECNARREAEAAAHAMLRFRETALAKLKEDFDPGALPALRRDFRKNRRSRGEGIGQLRQREAGAPAGRGAFPRMAGSLRQKERNWS